MQRQVWEIVPSKIKSSTLRSMNGLKVQNFIADPTFFGRGWMAFIRVFEGKQRIKHLVPGQYVTRWKASNSRSGLAWPIEVNPLLILRGSRLCRPHSPGAQSQGRPGPHPLTSLLNSSSVKPIFCLVIW